MAENAMNLGDILELRFSYKVNEQRCMNVLHWTPRANVNGKTAYEACGEFLDQFRAGGPGELYQCLLGWLSQDAMVDSISAQKIFKSRWRAFTWEGAVNGLNADSCKAQNVQASIEKIAENADRHGVGAIHLGGCPDSSYTTGMVSNQGLIDLGKVAAAMRLPITVGAGPVAVYDPVILNKVPTLVDGKTKYVISGFSYQVDTDVKEEIRVMNRRTVGRGI